jgi:hypothetical protein
MGEPLEPSAGCNSGPELGFQRSSGDTMCVMAER